MTTTMHFGPEWLRAKQPPAIRTHPSPPPPPAATSQPGNPVPPNVPTYSALLTPNPLPVQEKTDITHPFKYSKAEMLRIWKDRGGKYTLPIEVERWEGIIKESGGDPVGLKDMTDFEKKLFSSPLNSEIRRRQSVDQGPKRDALGIGSPMREGFPGMVGRRRRGDSNGADHPPLLQTIPRKQSWSSNQGSLVSPSVTSPRTRIGSSGFDGVLNNGDNWSGGKRRLSSAGNFPSRLDSEDTQKEEKAPEIKEEEEPSDPTQTTPPDPNLPATPATAIPASDTAERAMSSLSLTSGNIQVDDLSKPLHEVDKPDPMDPMNIEWSYLDFSGTVQGPFRAETMQSWYEQNYFTDELRIKRSRIDIEWTSLADIKRRSKGEKLFLSVISEPLVPPGLIRRASGPPIGEVPIPQSSVFDSPFQPVPRHSMRSNTVDSHMMSLSSASASPSSSFGAGGFGRSSISPDPSLVNNRFLGNQYSDLQFNGGRSNSATFPSGSPSLSFMTRRGVGEVPKDVAFGTRLHNDINSGRVPSADIHNRQHNMANYSWPQNNFPGPQSFDHHPQPDGNPMPTFGTSSPFAPHLDNTHFNSATSPFINGPGFNSYPVQPQDPALSPFGNPPFSIVGQTVSQVEALPAHTHSARNGFNLTGSIQDEPESINNFPPFPDAVPLAYQPTPAQRPVSPPRNEPVNHSPNLQAIHPPPPPADFTFQPEPAAPQQQQELAPVRPHVPWGPPIEQRPSPFDPKHPTARNTVITTFPKPSPWVRAADGPGDNGWGPTPDEAQQVAPPVATPQVAKQNTRPKLPKEALARPQENSSQSPTTSTVPARQDVPARAPKKKPTSPPQPSTETVPSPPPSAVSKSSPIVAPAQQKPVWAIDEEKTKAALDFRDIQDAELKRVEARKAYEKEKGRAVRAIVTHQTEEVQSFTWGLPTSQAGKTPATTPSGKESPSTPGSSTAVTPAWTASNKALPAKKTMKEIQEEEERRKKQGGTETVAQAAKRAADSKPSPTPPIASGGAWSTVGVGGKVTAPLTSPGRPSAPTQPVLPSAPPVTARLSNGSGAASRSVPKQVLTREEEPQPPSPEFLKWLRDTLRGLSNSVQFEEIAQMLLSFPLDPDPSTVELIAETVYGASTTLDGRRFAAEFIAKRKADATASRGSAAVSSSNGKTISLADVVKSQPKPAQADWGYKVVKKKGKANRA